MKKINESFFCIWCGRDVWPAEKTCRNHCPHCFISLHVDGEVPGERATDCHGIMKPVELDFKMSGWSRLLFRCLRCGKEHWNKAAEDDMMENLVLWRG